MMKRTFIALLLALLYISLAAGLAQAQGSQPNPPSDDAVNAIAKGLYCPVCENIPLDVCGTQACVQWRELIREKLAQGWGEARIKQYFVNQYGDRVLATPPARGFNWLVYLVPPLAILAGAYILFRAFSIWRAKAPQAAASIERPGLAQGDEYIRRLEEELNKR
ncbi:MAG TPA: cytochrome c-type biogenesis protein [Anaerolineales bacterium]|nr:cytochrome c-type biogenesis protein [Anaerolineales bacterium]